MNKDYCVRQCRDCKETFQVKWSDNTPFEKFYCGCLENKGVK